MPVATFPFSVLDGTPEASHALGGFFDVDLEDVLFQSKSIFYLAELLLEIH